MKKVSIKDIAQVVGVSVATVSIVLSGKNKNNRVSKELSEKILQVAEDMHYRPNRLAKSLQSGRSQMIGLLVADITNPFFASLAYFVQLEMQKKGYTVIIMNTDESGEQMASSIALLESRQVDGFIIVPAESGQKSVSRLTKFNVPLVFVDRYYPSMNVPSVLIDNYDISYQAVHSLVQQGCKKIGLLVLDNNLPHMEERKEGYTDALKEAGIYDDSLVRNIYYKTLENDVTEAVDSLVNGENGIDGLFFATNSIAIKGIRRLMEKKVHIGQDIKVICFDKNESYDFMPFDFEYIYQPINEMGALAAQLLIEQIETENPEIEQIHRVSAQLVSTYEETGKPSIK